MMSDEPPGVYGTMIRIGLAGQVWASAAGAARARAKPATRARRTSCFMRVSMVVVQPGASVAPGQSWPAAAAPFAAVGEVGAHRRPRRFAVAVGDGVEDRAVLGVDAAQVGLALVGRRGRGIEPGARDDRRAERLHQALEVRVLGRPGDLEMELKVSAHCVATLLDGLGERDRAPAASSSRLASLRRCAARPGRLGLDADPQLEHRHHVAQGGELVAADPEHGRVGAGR